VSNEVLLTVKAHKNILNAIKMIKANLIGHDLSRNCFPKHVIEVTEGRIEVTGR
jgi:hypothetical protein